jgi:phosphatidylglycerophosphate synthase
VRAYLQGQTTLDQGVNAMAHATFSEARRELAGLTAPVEKRALAWLASRMPPWTGPDQLTALGLLAMIAAGAAYAASGGAAWLLHVVNLCLLVNWFGDSLDGTLARYRQRTRPRYGFYVDHMVDAIGVLALLGGLALSGHMGRGIAAALLIAYYLLSIHVYLATCVIGTFKLSFGPIGGTELRLLLAAANLALLRWPVVPLFGREYRLFDVLGAFGLAGILAALATATLRTTLHLHRLERV